MQNNQYHHQLLLLFDPYSQTFLSCTALPPQAFMQYENSKLQIQNLPNVESRYPIKNSADFTVEVTEMNGEKKKYTLEQLAEVLPTHLSEGVVSPEIKDNKLTIVTHQKLDESYSNKILIKTDRDSFVVIPNYLIEKAREEEKNLKIKRAEVEENESFSKQSIWGRRGLDFIFQTKIGDADESLYDTVDRDKTSTLIDTVDQADNNSSSNDQPILVRTKRRENNQEKSNYPSSDNANPLIITQTNRLDIAR